MKHRRKRLGLVDDDDGYRSLLEAAFAATPDWTCVASCRDAEEALRQLPGLSPDLVLLDINLPGLQGDAAVSRIVARLPNVPIIMLTVVEDAEALFRSVQSGALGYLLKGASWTEIIAAAEEALRGGTPMTPIIASRILKRLRDFPALPAAPDITTAELAVLEGCARGETEIETAARLGKSAHTVHEQFRSILRKVGAKTRAQAVAEAMRRGWLRP